MPDSREEDLVSRCLAGKPGAWDDLWRRHGAALRRAAAARLGDGAEAEEACQKLMMKLAGDGARSLKGYRGGCALGTWLVLAALGEAADHARAEARQRQRVLRRAASPGEVPGPLAALCAAEDAGRLRAAMNSLPPRDRLVLTLVFWDGMSHAEAARALRVSPHSITSLREAALERLRRALA